ncbi:MULTISPECIES: hypothetical protein [unclassified Tolypothrix]|nr:MULTISPECIES: hypothetical protein [unclassified Tolypothrix]EKF01313.1 hypothetical protein FDUTEX481_07961 [Tolypothrix sp. PCC 7601]
MERSSFLNYGDRTQQQQKTPALITEVTGRITNNDERDTVTEV